MQARQAHLSVAAGHLLRSMFSCILASVNKINFTVPAPFALMKAYRQGKSGISGYVFNKALVIVQAYLTTKPTNQAFHIDAIICYPHSLHLSRALLKT